MTATVLESNDCKVITIAPINTVTNAKFDATIKFNLTIKAKYYDDKKDSDADVGEFETLPNSNANDAYGTRYVTSNNKVDYFEVYWKDGRAFKDGVYKFQMSPANNSNDTYEIYIVLAGNIENELYRRIRYNINNEKVNPSSYHETLYMLTMVKSIGVLTSLADSDQIVRILNMVKMLNIMNKYCAYDVQYYNE